jgi:hypothetical protein
MIDDIEEFCEKYRACEEGYQWALSTCKDMEDVWDKLCASEETCHHDWLVWIITREGVCDDKTLRLFAVFCCTRIWHLITDKRSRKAVCVAHRYALGRATDEELKEAHDNAWYVAWAAKSVAARSVLWCALWGAARSAAQHVARSAAWAAALSAAQDTEQDAARAAALDDYKKWIQKNVKNPFHKKHI